MNRILVQSSNPLDVRPEELSTLVDDLQNRGMDARLAYREQKGYGVTWWEVVLIWAPLYVGTRFAEAAINELAAAAVEWMKERFRRDPENERPKVALIVPYEEDKGDEGIVNLVIEVRSADSEPVSRPPEEHERRPRRKPPE